MDRHPFDRNMNSWEGRKRRVLSSMDDNAYLSPEKRLEEKRLEQFLKKCALAIGMKLKKIYPRGVPEAEVFFDIYYNDQNVCYLLKQWNSSILRFGDTIKLRKDFIDFKERFYQIHHICAVNYITLLFPPDQKKSPYFIISLETPVYLDNFNEQVLEKAVFRFRKCKEKIQPFLEITRN